MGERANPISIRSKRKITEALLELMKVTPFSKITIKDIVEQAGLTRQTFYHNFETKEDVLLCQLDEHMTAFVQYLSKRKVSDWEDVICCFFRFWQEHADFLKLLQKNNLIYLLSLRLPVYFETVKKAHFSQTDLTDAEARLWFAFVTGGMVNTLTSWLAAGGNLSARALAKMVLTMVDGTMLERNQKQNEGLSAEQIIAYLAEDQS